jgi:hypothetical protein
MRKILIVFVLLIFLTACSNYVNYDELDENEKAAYNEIISDEEGPDVKLSPGATRYWITYDSCVDTDGQAYDVAGQATLRYSYKGKSRSRDKTDFCRGDELREYICNGLKLAVISVPCDNCEDGECSDS